MSTACEWCLAGQHIRCQGRPSSPCACTVAVCVERWARDEAKPKRRVTRSGGTSPGRPKITANDKDAIAEDVLAILLSIYEDPRRTTAVGTGVEG